MFAGLLILGMFFVQAFCHSVAAIDSSSTPHHAGVAHHMPLAVGDSAPGPSAANATSAEQVNVPCSSDGFTATCSGNAVTSCLLVLFLAAGLLIPQNARAYGGSSRFIATTTAPVRFLGSSPNLHALGISRT